MLLAYYSLFDASMKLLGYQIKIQSFALMLLSIMLTVGAQVLAESSYRVRCVSLLLANNSNDLVRVPILLKQLERIKLNQSEWSETKFTDPKNHNSNNFTYLVHDIFGFNISEASKTIWYKSIPEEFNIFYSPNRISEVDILSASIITNNQLATYGGGFGVILKASSENFLAASSKDMQSSDLREALPRGSTEVANEINFLIEKNGLPPPEQILLGTAKNNHNEILLLGTSASGQKIEIVGFYVIKKGLFNTLEGQDMIMGLRGKPEGQMAQLIQLAGSMDLPIIELQMPRD